MTNQNITNTVLSFGYKATKENSTWKPRVTMTQQATILTVTKPISKKLTDAAWDNLMRYVVTGDLSDLTSENHTMLTKVVSQCKEKSPNESQAKRYWPRKIAAVMVESMDVKVNPDLADRIL